jgi:alanyl aminopeptidase
LLATAACAADPLPPPRPPTAPPPSAAPAPPPPPALRLPRTAAPTRYAATLTLVPSQKGFEGSVDIDLTFAEPTSFLWLNATEITVSEAHLEIAGRSVAARAVPGGEDFVGFSFAETVPAGAAKLHVAYRGELSDKDDRGIFKENEEGADYLFSQFENIEARRAFPCFDEPSFKVPWQLTLRVPEGDAAFSNTPAVSESREGGMKVVRFAETKPLPSYLVAFAVGPFEVVDAGKAGKKGTPLRVIAPRGRTARAKYAARVSGDLLAKLEDYFGIPYPYEKLDLVAVPQLVSFAAMENAGLITFAEPILLATPEEDTIAHQRYYAVTAAHEMGHQWFGDLATMAWWDDIWLNEAFATWIEEKVLTAYKPEWRWDLMRSRSTSRAMHGDSLVSARRMRQAIGSKDDIQNAFDEITYQKGAAVIGMFETFAGPDAFRRGIARYLKEHAHGNATSADFLAAVGAETNAQLAPAFSTFLDQPGVPLVRAELGCAAGKKGDARVKLSQKRYLPSGTPGAADQAWQIPVCIRWGAGKADGKTCTLLAEREATVSLAGAPSCPDWVMLNAADAGYYHGGYTAPAVAALLDRGFPKLTEAERLSVVRDLGALMASGDLALADVFARLPALVKDPSPEVLEGALGLVETIRDPMVPAALRPAFARFMAKTFGPRAHAVGWLPKAGEDDRVRLIRPQLLALVADRGDDAKLIAEATDLARRWIDGASGVPDEVVDAALVVAATRGDKKLYDALHAAVRKATDDARRRRLAHAMASFRDPAIVRESLELATTEELDPRLSVELLWQDPHMIDAVLEFFDKRYAAAVARVPGEVRAELPYMFLGACDDARRARIDALLAPRVAQLTGGPRNLAKVLERVALCSTQRKANEPMLTAFLKKF